ncbi:hypothetical protein FACHB389_19020 [Nostoc calcicola FACHB-389]|nr:hypothetical protein FACHB389_19020 [Nostoc calcicola FACHB-389]
MVLLSQPQPPDFAWVGDSVALEVRSRVDGDVIEFRKRSVDLAATVGDAVAIFYAHELKSRLAHCLQTLGFGQLVVKSGRR